MPVTHLIRFSLLRGFFKLFGKKFVFDHHDINPELYEAKFGKRDFFYKALCALERATFSLANVSIATNESYRRLLLDGDTCLPIAFFVVRSGPKLERLKQIPPSEQYAKAPNIWSGMSGLSGTRRRRSASKRSQTCRARPRAFRCPLCYRRLAALRCRT